MKNIFIYFLNWFTKRRVTKKYSKTVFVSSVREVPEKIKRNIYVVGSEGNKKWVIFICPCYQKNIVEVNLMKSKKPYWYLTVSSKKVTLWPSVIVKDKCNCHFWLRNNKAYKC